MCPALLPDRDDPGPRSERRDRGEQLRLDLVAPQAAARRAQQQLWLGARGEAGGEQVLALGHEQALALAVLALPQPADQFQLLVLWAGDHLVSLLFWCFFSWNRDPDEPGTRA